MTRLGDRDVAVVLQASSVLLQYPDEGVLGRLPLVRSAVTALPAGVPHTCLLDVADHLATTDPGELARHYVEVLDRRRRCCLYLSWWRDGETRRRGMSLLALKQRYAEHGFGLAGGELPDFLPLMLEFAAAAPPGVGRELLQEHRAGLELLRLALVDAGTPYAEVVRAVCEVLPGPSPGDRAAAEAMARTGPPVEQVGLEPFSLLPVGGAR